MIRSNKKLKAFIISVTLIYLPALTGLALIVLISRHVDVPIAKFLRDPSSITGVSPYLGFMSNIGVLIWCATATICMFTWIILRRQTSRIRFSRFVCYSGFLTTLLMLDDLFLGHEKLISLGVSEIYIMIYYGLLVLYLMLGFKDIIKKDFFLLIMALAFFGLSFAVDGFQEHFETHLGQWRILFEDGFKFLGIVGWFGYFSKRCLWEIRNIGFK